MYLLARLPGESSNSPSASAEICAAPLEPLLRYRDVMKALLVAVLLASLGVAAQGDADIVGTWNLTVAWPQSPSAVELLVEKRDEGLFARWSGPRGTLDADGVAFQDGELRFVLEVTSTTDGSTFKTVRLPFRARLEGDRLEGTLRSPNGGELAVEGSRARDDSP